MNPMLKHNRQCVQVKYTFKVNSLSDELLVWPAQENYVKHSSSEIIYYILLYVTIKERPCPKITKHTWWIGRGLHHTCRCGFFWKCLLYRRPHDPKTVFARRDSSSAVALLDLCEMLRGDLIFHWPVNDLGRVANTLVCVCVTRLEMSKL